MTVHKLLFYHGGGTSNALSPNEVELLPFNLHPTTPTHHFKTGQVTMASPTFT